MIKPKTSRIVRALGQRLGKGEAEAIVLAIERDANLVILDDHVARMEAIRLGLEVKGTLGIVKRLIELGRFKTDLKELYYRLRALGFRIKEGLFWEIFSDI